MRYVYELINTYGTIEYVGLTKDTHRRFEEHVKKSPNGSGIGKFHGRQDLIMNVAYTVNTLKEARDLEAQLQKEYGLSVDREVKKSNLLKNRDPFAGTKAALEKESFRTAALAASRIERTCKCGRTIKGNGFFSHIKKCTK